jgi:hypothetical protein
MLKTHFKRRGYPHSIVEEAYNKALSLDRETLLKPKENNPTQDTKNDMNFLVTTYSPGQNIAREIVTDNWPLLGTSNITNHLYESRVIHGHRRCKSLRDHLIRARIDPEPALNKTPKPKCKTKKCSYCPKLNTSGKIVSSMTGRNYISKHNVSCKSSNLIYCITCKTCSKQYVGQTKNRLMDRFVKHFYHIKKDNKLLPIARHFNLPDHKQLDDIEIHIVDFIYRHPDSQEASKLRDKIEKNWILRLRTSAPHGINTMDVKKF